MLLEFLKKNKFSRKKLNFFPSIRKKCPKYLDKSIQNVRKGAFEAKK